MSYLRLDCEIDDCEYNKDDGDDDNVDYRLHDTIAELRGPLHFLLRFVVVVSVHVIVHGNAGILFHGNGRAVLSTVAPCWGHRRVDVRGGLHGMT